jgi:outer membrane protein assembly factor BamA
MIKKAALLIFIAIIFIPHPKVFSQTQKIGKIEFSKDIDTPYDILKTVTELQTGEEFTNSKLEKAIQNLKNTTVFNPVIAEIKENPNVPGTVDILFKMEKKWTIIPYIIFGSGGGTTYYAIGVFDTNFLNRLYTTNLSFRMENNEPNFSASFVNKYTLDLPLITGISAQLENRKEIYYTSDNQINGYLSYQQSSINPYALWKFYDYFLLGGGFDFQDSYHINGDLSSSESNTNQQNNIAAPDSFSTIALQVRFTLGKIDYDDLAENGIILNSISNTTAGMYQGNNQSDDYNDTSNTILGFYTVPSLKNSYLALRLANMITTSDNPIRQYYIGGLDKIRGFNYSQFNGKVAFYSNFEFRYTTWEGKYIALQLVPFLDLTNVGNTLNQVFSQQAASSYGFGIRIPLKKINKIAIRLDFAETITPFKMNGVSFGLTQFF